MYGRNGSILVRSLPRHHDNYHPTAIILIIEKKLLSYVTVVATMAKAQSSTCRHHPCIHILSFLTALYPS